MIRILTAAVLGALVAAAATGLFTKDDGYLNATLVLAIAFVVLLLLGVVGLVGAFSGTGAWGIADFVQRAESEGRLAAARLVGIRETGTRINAQPLCELDLVVAPEGVAPYRTTIRSVLSIVDIARRPPGTPLVVGIRRPGQPEVALVPSPPAHWAEKAASTQFPAPESVRFWHAPRRRLTPFGSAPILWQFLAFVVGALVTLLPLLFR